MSDEEIKLGVEVQQNAVKELKAASDALQKFATIMEKSFQDGAKASEESSKKTGDALKGLNSNLKNSTGALDAFKGAFGAIVASQVLQKMAEQVVDVGKALVQTFIVDGVHAAAEAESAMKLLENQMRSTGEFSRQAAEDFEAFAAQMQALTTVEDDAVISGLALAKTFGATNEEAKKLVKTAIDLAAAKGVSLDTAIAQLGGTLNGVAGQLGKTNSEVRNLTKEQLVAGNAIDIVAKQFSGAGAAAANTYAGALIQAQNAFGNLQEAFGKIIIENKSVIAVIGEVKKVFDEMSGVIEANAGVIGQHLSEAIVFTLTGFRYFVYAVDLAYREIVKFVAGCKDIIETVQMVGKVIGSIPYGFKAMQSAAADWSKSMSDRKAEIDKNFTEPLGGDLAKIIQQIEEAAARAGSAREAASGGVDQGQGDKQDRASDFYDIEEAQRKVDAEVDLLIRRNEMLKTIGDEASKKQIESNNETLEQIRRGYESSIDTKLKIDANYAKEKQDMERRSSAASREVLGGLAQFQNSKVKEIAFLARAASVMQITIDGIAAVQRVYKDIPFPFSIPASILMGGIVAANAAKAAGVKGLKSGITEVPGTGSEDSYGPVFLAPRERVVDAHTNQDLKGFLGGAQQMVPILASILDRLRAMNMHTTVNVGGREIADVVREQSLSGRAVG